MTDYDADARDPGLTAERTDLAWSRSGLSLIACAAAILKGIGRPSPSTGRTVVGVVVFVLGLATSLLGWWHGRRLSRDRGRQTTRRDLMPITVGVALVGVAAFVVALVAWS